MKHNKTAALRLFVFCFCAAAKCSIAQGAGSSPAVSTETVPVPSAAATAPISDIPYGDPAHAAFFRYQAYMAASQPYRGRLFPYFRIFMTSEGEWASDARSYPLEHWYTPSNEEEWNALSQEQRLRKAEWTEQSLARVLKDVAQDRDLLAKGRPNATELSDMIRSLWGKDVLKKFQDYKDAAEDPEDKPRYDKAKSALRNTLEQMAKTLPGLDVAALFVPPENVSDRAVSRGSVTEPYGEEMPLPISVEERPASEGRLEAADRAPSLTEEPAAPEVQVSSAGPKASPPAAAPEN